MALPTTTASSPSIRGPPDLTAWLEESQSDLWETYKQKNGSQCIDDAVWQYKTDRLPKLAGQTPEPLLSFPSGALVHFAVSTREVRMTTKLAGPATVFLPFNKGSDPGGKNCGAGNPVPDGSHREQPEARCGVGAYWHHAAVRRQGLQQGAYACAALHRDAIALGIDPGHRS